MVTYWCITFNLTQKREKKIEVNTNVVRSNVLALKPLSIDRELDSPCTVQPHYNASHYSAVFNITQSCHGSQINYFAICLL